MAHKLAHDGGSDRSAAASDSDGKRLLNRRLDATDDGDEVYVPATESSHPVTGWDRVIDVPSSMNDVRLYGDGEESRIEYGGNDGRTCS